MPIKDYSSKVDVFQTLGEIQGMLVKHGAKKVLQEFDDDGKVISVSFMINTPMGMQAVKLPANVDAVQKVLAKQRVKSDREQAERTAWRIIKDWIAAQMAILESQMVTMDEIFLPYILNIDGQTVYKLFTNNQLLLGGGQ